MRDKLVLWFLGLIEASKYTLEQSHGVPPVSVAFANTTLREKDACGYSSVKTVRSIDTVKRFFERHPVPLQLDLPMPAFADFADAYQARWTVVRMWYEGWNKKSIAGCLKLSRTQRNTQAIASGRVDLRHGAVERLPFDDHTFDKTLAINAMQVWPDAVAGLREMRRVLKTGGRIALGFTPYAGQPQSGVPDHVGKVG